MTLFRFGKTVSTTSLLSSLLLLSFLNATLSEIRNYNGVISAASSYIHFSEGYIVAPGFIDLSNLVFIADNAPISTYANPDLNGDDNGDKQAPDEVGQGEDKDDEKSRQKADAASVPTTAPIDASTAIPVAAPTKSPVIAVATTKAPVAALVLLPVEDVTTNVPVAALVAPSVEVVTTKAPIPVPISPPVKAVLTETPLPAPVEPPAEAVKATGAPIAAAANADKNGARDIRRRLGEIDSSSSSIDIVFFHEPAECSNTRKGCDWTKLGIGASDEDGNVRWCCSDDAITLGLCNNNKDRYNRLIINEETFQGEHRFVTIPSSDHIERSIQDGKIDVKESGKYTLVVTNCDDNGRDLIMTGPYTWKSKNGFLPGDLFGEWYFDMLVTLVYTAVFTCYSISMRRNKDSTIPIQKWILITIALGVVETFFKSGDYWIWNMHGTRAWYMMYAGVIIGVLKDSISRCIVVMVSLGWGVVRDTLGDQLRNIIILGVMYCGVAIARDIMTVFAVTEFQKLSVDEEENLFDAVTILTFVVIAINVTFYMWILDAINGTMQYLENMNQRMKLKRYLRLRLILLLYILFAVVLVVFGIVDTYTDTSIMQVGQYWVVQAAWELNYILVLLSVALLWRPNPNAKDYAFVIELSAVGDDTELVTNADTIEDDNDENYIGYRDTLSGEEGMMIGDDLKA